MSGFEGSLILQDEGGCSVGLYCKTCMEPWSDKHPDQLVMTTVLERGHGPGEMSRELMTLADAVEAWSRHVEGNPNHDRSNR